MPATPTQLSPGIAPPSLTQTQINAIPAADLWKGRQVYNSTTGQNQIYDNTGWVALTGSGGLPAIPSANILGGTSSGTFTGVTVSSGLTLSGGSLTAVPALLTESGAASKISALPTSAVIAGTEFATVTSGGNTNATGAGVKSFVLSGGVTSTTFVTSGGQTATVINGIITSIA